MIKIILAEDHLVVRDGIKLLLEKVPEFKIIAEADNGKEVLQQISDGLIPDVILADISMPLLNGIGLLKELSNLQVNARVIILSMYDNDDYIINSFKEGASGYLLKSVNQPELVFAINHVYAGNQYLYVELALRYMLNQKNRHLSAPPIKIIELYDFTSREMEVLKLVAEGLTNDQMSEKLFLSKRTIEGHRNSLINKAGVKNTATLIKFAVLNGLVV